MIALCAETPATTPSSSPESEPPPEGGGSAYPPDSDGIGAAGGIGRIRVGSASDEIELMFYSVGTDCAAELAVRRREC